MQWNVSEPETLQLKATFITTLPCWGTILYFIRIYIIVNSRITCNMKSTDTDGQLVEYLAR